MASKETTAAGFANVSREITGELPTRDDFFGEKCVFNTASSTPEKARGGMRAALGTRTVSFLLLSCSLNNLFPLRLI